jgi:hypothetical protein
MSSKNNRRVNSNNKFESYENEFGYTDDENLSDGDIFFKGSSYVEEDDELGVYGDELKVEKSYKKSAKKKKI